MEILEGNCEPQDVPKDNVEDDIDDKLHPLS